MKSLLELKFEAEEAMREYKEAMASRKVYKVSRTYQVTIVNEVEAANKEEARDKSYKEASETSLDELLELDNDFQLLKYECKHLKNPSEWED
jgi:hypothetical protein